jgi:flagellar biosynthesis/type III secretory pathway M-ring protein FliF/YscJ
MDAALGTFGRLLEPWRSMSPAARWGIGLFGLIAVVVAGIYWTHDAAADVELMPRASTSFGQLSAMMSAFAKAGLQGHEVRGTSIWVPHSRKDAYLAALADAKLLPQDFGTLQKDASLNDNWFKSDAQRRDEFRLATEAELARIIRAMQGVENASVLYAEDTKPGFNPVKVVTATVSVKPVGSSQLDEMRVSAIRYLVSGAIAGLTPEHVTVCDLNGPTWYGPAGARTGDGHDACPKPASEPDPKETTFQGIDQPERGRASAGWNRETLQPLVPACAAVAAIGLVLLGWKALRAIGNQQAAAAGQDRPAGAAAADAGRSPVGPPHWRHDAGSQSQRPSEELSALVADDPEAAADVLRNWIGPVD